MDSSSGGSRKSLLLEDPNEKYTLLELLGEGSYGSVFKAVSSDSDTEVAVKIIPCESADEIDNIISEIDFLKRLATPYVVSYIKSYLFENELWIIMEYCGGGSMSDLLQISNSTFQEECIRAIVAYSVLGLAHVHSINGIHRDIKAGNILLTIDGKAKLADFGVSVQLTNTLQKRKTITGTPYWIAPEVVQEISYDSKADIWSLGVTILELCEGHPPYYNVHPMRAIFMISMKPAPTLMEPDKWSADMKDFLDKCLVKTSESRASATNLLEHPWIAADIAIVQENQGMECLRQLVAKSWDAIVATRLVRRKSLSITEDALLRKKLGNQALRRKVNLVGRKTSVVNRNAGTSKLSSLKMFKRDGTLGSFDGDGTFMVVNADGADGADGAPEDVPYSSDTFHIVSTGRSGRSHESSVDDYEATLNFQSITRNAFDNFAEETLKFASTLNESFIEDVNGMDLTEVTLVEDITEFRDKVIYYGIDPNQIYARNEILGKGSYGIVFRAENTKSSDDVAIKVLPCPHVKDLGTEIELFKQLQSPYIVSFYQGYVYNREVWIVMEYCAGGSISDIIRFGKKPLDEPQLVGVVANCVLGLAYLHSFLFIHRDVKAGNVLLTKDGKVKLTDFGVSVKLTQTLQQRNTLIGTPFWMAPEVIQEQNYDSKADIWGLGVTILEMCEGHPPHFDVHPMRAVFLIPKDPAPILQEPDKWSGGLHAFLARCLVKEPSGRSPCEELLLDPWLQSTADEIRANGSLKVLEDFAAYAIANKRGGDAADKEAVE